MVDFARKHAAALPSRDHGCQHHARTREVIHRSEARAVFVKLCCELWTNIPMLSRARKSRNNAEAFVLVRFASSLTCNGPSAKRSGAPCLVATARARACQKSRTVEKICLCGAGFVFCINPLINCWVIAGFHKSVVITGVTSIDAHHASSTGACQTKTVPPSITKVWPVLNSSCIKNR